MFFSCSVINFHIVFSYARGLNNAKKLWSEILQTECHAKCLHKRLSHWWYFLVCPRWRIFTSVAVLVGSFVHFTVLDEKDIPVLQQNKKNKFAREVKGELEGSFLMRISKFPFEKSHKKSETSPGSLSSKGSKASSNRRLSNPLSCASPAGQWKHFFILAIVSVPTLGLQVVCHMEKHLTESVLNPWQDLGLDSVKGTDKLNLFLLHPRWLTSLQP